MPSKISLNRTVYIVFIAGIAFAASVVPLLTLNQSSQAADTKLVLPSGSQTPSQVGSGLPIRFKIPKINVDAAVEYVGVARGGAMDVPKKIEDVAWYASGTRPGDIGSAVLAGHYGRWKNGQGSVFDDLHTLQKGDFVSVEDDRGKTTTFIVRESRTYDEHADAITVFTSDDGQAHLNLVTCEGVWDPKTKSYPKRLVVFTDKVPE